MEEKTLSSWYPWFMRSPFARTLPDVDDFLASMYKFVSNHGVNRSIHRALHGSRVVVFGPLFGGRAVIGDTWLFVLQTSRTIYQIRVVFDVTRKFTPLCVQFETVVWSCALDHQGVLLKSSGFGAGFGNFCFPLMVLFERVEVPCDVDRRECSPRHATHIENPGLYYSLLETSRWFNSFYDDYFAEHPHSPQLPPWFNRSLGAEEVPMFSHSQLGSLIALWVRNKLERLLSRCLPKALTQLVSTIIWSDFQYLIPGMHLNVQC